jgi:D-lyxose ketol-isomerase
VKRSQINAIIRESLAFLEERRFLLPPFAFWTPEDWRRRGPECREIAANQLGWDITDFGSGDFGTCGLFLFTLRNGSLADLERAAGKSYAEKILIVKPGQVTPHHFHFQKMEDIINRGGGDAVIQFWNADAGERLADTRVRLSFDGVERDLAPGEEVRLAPGESVSIPQRVYHKFWGGSGRSLVLLGEVSRVNDDHTDNRFLEPTGRFPAVEEDEPPLHLLVGDYRRYYRHA